MGWWKTAHVGQKVVCVDNEPSPGTVWGMYEQPILSEVYTISAIFLGHDANLHIEFCELRRDDVSKGIYGAVGYNVRRFRPAQTKSTDTGMAILKRILERPHQRIEEDA